MILPPRNENSRNGNRCSSISYTLKDKKKVDKFLIEICQLILVPVAGLEPARLPAAFWVRCVCHSATPANYLAIIAIFLDFCKPFSLFSKIILKILAGAAIVPCINTFINFLSLIYRKSLATTCASAYNKIDSISARIWAGHQWFRRSSLWQFGKSNRRLPA